jgi:predicted RNA-binding protein with PIN domain
VSGESGEPVVLVDAQNVRRSTWPNIAPADLVELVAGWATEEDCRAVVVFDGQAPAVDTGDAPIELVSSGSQTADDRIARRASELRDRGIRFWLVTSDRDLRARAGPGAERVIGGGAFARTLVARRAS